MRAAAPASAAPAKKKSWYRQPWFVALEYPLVRMWSMVIGCFSIEANLATARLIGRFWWRISAKHRRIALENLRASYPNGEYTDVQLTEIARGAFEHWAQVYLVELALTPRLLTRWSWRKYVELGNLQIALRELLLGRGAILVTPHFGTFELLGSTLCRLGIPLVAVMRPLDNEKLNNVLGQTRAVTGLRLLDHQGMTEEAQKILPAGTPVCFIADQDAGKKGYFVEFFGRPASTYKSIALLAVQYNLPVICGSAARIGRGFRYRLECDDLIRPEDWAAADNPALWITERFSRAMETAIRRHPEQYLWFHRRWKNQPKKAVGTSGERVQTT